MFEDSMPVIQAIQVGRPRTHDGAEPWLSAIEKTRVDGPVALTPLGLEGDAQADRVNHGGPDKAICAYAWTHYPYWRDRLGLQDLPAPGAFGENLTLTELTEETVCIGDVYRAGNAALQVSQPRQPCWKLARRWGLADFAEQVVASNRTGWYFRVLQGGHIEAGASLVLADRPHAAWTITAANDVMHCGGHDAAASAALADVAALSDSWKRTLLRRVAR